MTRKETVRNLLTELIDIIDNGSQRDLDRADEIGTSIIKLFEQEPCEDAISRQAAIVHLSHNKNGDDDCDVIIQKDIETIKALPSVNPQPKTGHWIPVSERVPKEYRDVLVSTNAEEVFIAQYLGKMNDGTDCFDDDNGMMWEGDVIAWMPLPAPFESQEMQ